MKASDLFVKALEAEGVEFIFGIPGEENLDLLNSLKDSKRIKLVLNRHEQAAGFMAATYGRLTGRTGVCMSTLGPGATNLVTAAAYAQLAGTPMLMVTGQKPIKTSKQARFQILDVVEMMGPLTKYTTQIVSGASIPSRVREAFRLAEEERPGAVHLELPEDIACEEVDMPLLPRPNARRSTAASKALREAASMIESARHPLVLIGAGANRKSTTQMLRHFLEQTQIPYFTTQMGKGVIDERHPLYLGTAALSDNDHLHCSIARADLIINIGHDVIEKPPFFMQHDGFRVIHLNFSSAEVDPVYFPQIEVIGDIGNSVLELAQLVEPQPHWDFDYFFRVKKQMQADLTAGEQDDSFPVVPPRLVAEVRRAMPDDSILALDNGVYKIWFALNYLAAKSNSVLLDNALATMGAGLPSAMAARLVNPDKKVLAVCGDGGFMMNSQELETAVRLQLDIVVLVLRDDAYGMIKWKQEGMGFANFGLDYGNPDFVRYAESYGARGVRVASIEELQPVLCESLDASGVTLVEVPVDYTMNKKLLDKNIQCPE